MAREQGSSTRAVHAGSPPPEAGAPIVRPIYPSTTFYTGRSPEGEVLYTRYGNNPNHIALGARLAALEGTEAALVVGSGMAAIAMTLLSFTGAGDHIVAARELYGGTLDLLSNELPRFGVQTTFVASERSWRSSLRARTRLLYVEALSNPLLRVADLPGLAKLATERGIPLVVDATFTPPVWFRAAEHGADVVVHSATKYLGGHSDVTAGVVAAPEDVVEEVRARMKRFGSVLDPHATWMLERGLKTLAVRVERQCATAQELAKRLSTHPRIAAVHYPGLESHPDHERAKELFGSFGSMLGVVVAGDDDAALDVLSRLELVSVAPSLGGVESLASMPRFTSHAHLSRDERRRLGIEDGFIRLSIGIEDLEDIWEDLRRGLG